MIHGRSPGWSGVGRIMAPNLLGFRCTRFGVPRTAHFCGFQEPEVKRRTARFTSVKESDRGGSAAAIIRELRARLVDDLELGELREPFLGEFGADARLLGATERNMRRHVEVLVDPDRSGLDLACHLVRPRRVRRPHRCAEPRNWWRRRGGSRRHLSEYLITGSTGPNCSSSRSREPSLMSRTMVG